MCWDLEVSFLQSEGRMEIIYSDMYRRYNKRKKRITKLLSEKNSFIPGTAFSRSLCDPLSTAAFFLQEKELSFISLDYEKDYET